MGEPNIEKMKAERDIKGLAKALKDKDWSVRREAAAALGNIGDAGAVEPLIQALKDESENPRLLATAAWALSEIGELTVEHLIQALKDENKNVRLAAAWALGEIRDPRAEEPLIQVVEPLIQAMEDKDWDVRLAAALENIGNVEAVEHLIQALEDKDWDVRLAAAGALKKIRDSRAA